MARKRLNKDHRQTILNWMIKEKLNTDPFEKEQETKISSLCQLINIALRKKYPESDMVVLRKYNSVRKDTCLNFAILDTGQVYGVNFYTYGSGFSASACLFFEDNIADIPSRGGYKNRTVFEGTEEIRDIYDSLLETYESYYEQRQSKMKEYKSFVMSCKYLEDVEKVVVLPEDVRNSITEGSTALIAINSELINKIKKDFN